MKPINKILGKSTKRNVKNLLKEFITNSVNNQIYFSIVNPKDISEIYLIYYPIWAKVKEPINNTTEFNITL